jgi:hypothetical protein
MTKAIVTTPTRRLGWPASVLASATFVAGAFAVVPAIAAADTSGCRGDQACIKITQETQCDKPCQDACKVYRLDQELCHRIWGPKLQFQREQERQGKSAGT